VGFLSSRKVNSLTHKAHHFMGLLNMPKKSDRSGICNSTRFGVRLPGIPLPTEEVLQRKIRGLKLRDLQTKEIRTPFVSIQQAAIETLQLLKKYKAEIDQDLRVVEELLRLNPYFIRFQWVADAADRLERCQRAKRRHRRPKWRYTITPEVILGLVWVLRESGEASSNRDAADWLEISGIMSSWRVRRLLKQANKDPRLKPVLSPPPDKWPIHTEEDLMRMYESAITPEEGHTLRFELRGDHFQYIGTQNDAEQPCGK
jgi:hypothetical protein